MNMKKFKLMHAEDRHCLIDIDSVVFAEMDKTYTGETFFRLHFTSGFSVEVDENCYFKEGMNVGA